MSVKCSNIIRVMEKIAPTSLAEKWDNVGLQVGDTSRAVKKVMICLELNNDVMDEAIEKDVDMIITHHPLIFKPLKNLVSSDPIVRIISKLIKNDICLYSSHTNLDNVDGGTSDYFAELLNIRDLSTLTISHTKKYYKLVVFIPDSHLEGVSNAIGIAGAGQIGNYSHCTFQSKGMGTFKPLEESNPYIGKAGEIERVSEYKLEAIVPQDKLGGVIEAMTEAHPYEEVAYDVIPLENKIEAIGSGRVGYLETEKTTQELAKNIKALLGAQRVSIVGDENKTLKKVAICPGSGADFIRDAYKNNCDCYITGDVKYHDAQLAIQLGINIIDAGHYDTEKIICSPLKQRLLKELKEESIEIDVITSDIDINPYKIV